MASGHAIKYTQTMLDWVQANQADIARSKLTELFNAKFNMKLGRGTLDALCKRNKWKSNISARFTKGQKAWNDGLTGYMGANKTSFKKGQSPHNHKPVGSERITKDGYIQIKIKEPRTWQLKHIVEWEKHNGKLPKNHCVRLLDNDRTNCDISNLLCIPRGAHATSNKQNKAQTNNAELNKAVLLTETLKHSLRGNK